MQRFQKLIFYLFAGIFFLVPLILWPYTSEVFEFNKIVVVYFLTTLIVCAWIVRSIIARKIIFRPSILDIPILVFIGSQLISTIISIDPLTSWLGYYSRFNGGLASMLCYALLYWAFVSNIVKEDVVKLIKVLLSAGALVSIYGVLEHFGIDKDVWVQDVASRVFSTLGQPNWLAAWLVALLPITWALAINKKKSNIQFSIYLALAILFFITLLFTKSRSGLLGFAVADVIFWAGYFWVNQNENIKKFLTPFAICHLPFAILALAIGTQFTPSLSQLLRQQSTFNSQHLTAAQAGPALETGGTESGTIRKIVWKGAIDVWRHYPIFGAGVETFAFSYYKFRPMEHNLVSEWDFIYNKAHNEFLNMAANSGSVGLLSYLFLIGTSIYVFVEKSKSPELRTWSIALMSGYISLSATNFFGFAVVPTELTFFLFPALAIALERESERAEEFKPKKLTSIQKLGILISCSFALILLFSISKYWYADTLFAKGKAYNATNKPNQAIKYLASASKLEPNQALYHNELANSLTNIALAYNQQKDTANFKKFIDLATSESEKAVTLSPANVNLKRSRFGIFIMLSTIDQNYLINAQNTLIGAMQESPTDAKLYYNLGLTYARTGQLEKALEILSKAIQLKSNYKEARLAYAILLINMGNKTEAKNQLEYILGSIDPNDSLTKQTLESVK